MQIACIGDWILGIHRMGHGTGLTRIPRDWVLLAKFVAAFQLGKYTERVLRQVLYIESTPEPTRPAMGIPLGLL
jgi:hypothetical protein